MPIYYTVIEKGTPGVPGGGEKRYYANTITAGETGMEEIVRRIEMNSTLSGGDIYGVNHAMTDVIAEELADGQIVRIYGLGSFRVSLSSSGHRTEEEVGDASILGTRILYRPGPKLLRMQRTLSFKKVPG